MQFKPRLTGASGSPWVATILPPLVPTSTPQPVPQKRQAPLSQRTPSAPWGAADMTADGTAIPAVVAAAAIAAELTGQERPTAAYANTCYSLIGTDYGISVAGVYQAQGSQLIEVPDSGGVSPLDGNAAFRAAEARYGAAWYAAISADIWDR